MRKMDTEKEHLVKYEVNKDVNSETKRKYVEKKGVLVSSAVGRTTIKDDEDREACISLNNMEVIRDLHEKILAE